jgi:hypothetical protein
LGFTFRQLGRDARSQRKPHAAPSSRNQDALASSSKESVEPKHMISNI